MELNEIVKLYSDYYASHPCAIRLRKDQVGIEPIFDNDKSKGGLWIPEQAKSRCSQGIVKYLGPLVKDIQVGDYVLFSGYNGDLIKLEDELMIVMPEDFIQARVVEIPFLSIFGNRMSWPELLQEVKMQIGPLTEMTNKLESRQSETS